MLKHLGRMQGKAWGAHAPLDLGGKPWLLKPFYYFFTPSDLTRHDDTAFGPQAVQSYLVKSEGVKKVVRRLEEPGFPATLDPDHTKKIIDPIPLQLLNFYSRWTVNQKLELSSFNSYPEYPLICIKQK